MEWRENLCNYMKEGRSETPSDCGPLDTIYCSILYGPWWHYQWGGGWHIWILVYWTYRKFLGWVTSVNYIHRKFLVISRYGYPTRYRYSMSWFNITSPSLHQSDKYDLSCLRKKSESERFNSTGNETQDEVGNLVQHSQVTTPSRCQKVRSRFRV